MTMQKAEGERSPRTYCVLDLECRPDPLAGALARAGERSHSGLMRIDAGAILVATESGGGAWSAVELHSFEHEEEFDVLMEIDESLARLAAPSTTLVTFNGRNHDLPLIQRRAARHWMFGLPGIDAVRAFSHRDLMMTLTWSRREARPSLRDSCASLGIPMNSLLVTKETTASPKRRKAETDVVATFLLLLYELAIERGSADVLGGGWEALVAKRREARWRQPHLRQFLQHIMLEAWRERDLPGSSRPEHRTTSHR